MTWELLLERVRRGETTVDDANLLQTVRMALDHLAQSYPGDGNYFSALGRLLKLHTQMCRADLDGEMENQSC
jgi:hypothetical protein